MLIKNAIASGIRAGTVRAQYRCWDAPRVTVGATQLTAAGLVRVTGVSLVDDLDRLTDPEARAAGMADAPTLRAALRKSTRGARVYRIDLEWAGEDPRAVLREQIPDDEQCASLYQRLSRLDRRPSGEWTREVLEWIRDHPHVVSTRLAEERATDRAALKTDIRKLKALGLTISHDVGYELSPRGIAYLAWLDSRHGTD
ncbi:ASCH domain-containing protein [Gordonia crocea]|uniref:ASCH domain-containing protein n=1 Tax=Gordonia crocea TaxID=589162 RepID=A0A7I9UY21_9ACTN|nr:ASCH domain-containing protein [Gordonia crocea]GED97776.1 hypothetical protein nbrc107697_18150 [Gordonia crocea]